MRGDRNKPVRGQPCQADSPFEGRFDLFGWYLSGGSADEPSDQLIYRTSNPSVEANATLSTESREGILSFPQFRGDEGVRRNLIVALAAVAAIAGATSSATRAQPVEECGALPSPSAEIVPSTLPRTKLAPVSLQGDARFPPCASPQSPPLTEAVIEINKNAAIDTTGLPTCTRGRLETIDTSISRQACDKAIVGKGQVTVRNPAASSGATDLQVNFYNGGARGGTTTMFMAGEVSAPAPSEFLVSLKVTRLDQGPYSLQAVAKMPPITDGYLTALDFDLRRSFYFEGAKRSFLAAKCPAPTGFAKASLTFAQTNFTYADGSIQNSTLVGECKVRPKKAGENSRMSMMWNPSSAVQAPQGK